MTNLKRIVSLLLCLVLIASLSAFAAGVPFSSSKPVKTYCLATSGRIQVYTNSACTATQGTEYIDADTDEIILLEYNSKYDTVLVRYPVANGTKDRWVPANKIIPGSVKFTNAKTATLTKDIQGYRWATGNTTYGYGEKGDKIYIFGQSGSRTFVMWPISAGFRLAAVNTAELSSAIASSSSSGNTTLAFDWPMSGAYCTWSGYSNTTMSWSEDSGSGNSRSYHLGVDMYGSNSNVLAAADGVVAACSNSNSGANGRYVVLSHKIGNKTIYTFYAHLSSVTVSKGATVKRGQRIAIAGGSGNGSENYYGTHLHFAVVDTLWSGSYYGYAYSFSGNTKYFEGVTYYSPKFVIDNDRLPG